MRMVEKSVSEGKRKSEEENTINNYSRDFHVLVQRVQSCRLCPRMDGRLRVFGPANGSLEANTLFIAEAPGRLGADRIRIPLYGDQSGRNFDLLLQAAQLDRKEIFITNAVLCNPRDAQGNNAPPTNSELMQCAQHLRSTIELLQPRFVVTLGQVALRALNCIATHEVVLSAHVGNPRIWNERWLIALYHPGARARIYRSLALQQEDFRNLGAFIRNGERGKSE
jgi:uracil-DNA glycosylase family 4